MIMKQKLIERVFHKILTLIKKLIRDNLKSYLSHTFCYVVKNYFIPKINAKNY